MKKEKRKTAKEYLEYGLKDKPEYEQAWLKAPLKIPTVISDVRKETGVSMDEECAKQLYKKGYRTHIHTHPVYSNIDRIAATPSSNDLYQFFLEDWRNMVIAQSDSKGSIQGYTIIRKPKKFKHDKKLIKLMREYNEHTRKVISIPFGQQTPEHLKRESKKYEMVESLLNKSAEEPKQDITENTNVFEDLDVYRNKRDIFSEDKEKIISDGKEVLNNLNKFSHKYGIKYRFVPMPGYQFDQENAMFVKKRPEKSSGIERKLEIIAFTLLGITFLLQLFNFSRITSFAVLDNFSKLTNISNFLTVVLIFISLTILFYAKIKKNKK